MYALTRDQVEIFFGHEKLETPSLQRPKVISTKSWKHQLKWTDIYRIPYKMHTMRCFLSPFRVLIALTL